MLHNGVFVTFKRLSDNEYKVVKDFDSAGIPSMVWNSEPMRHLSRAPLLHKYKRTNNMKMPDDRRGLVISSREADNESLSMLLKLSAVLDNCDY